MASSYTVNNGIEKPATGEQSFRFTPSPPVAGWYPWRHGNMRPVGSVDDVTNDRLTNLVAVGDFSLCEHPAYPHFAHEVGVDIREFRVGVIRSALMPFFLAHICDVVLVCSKPQVPWVTASRIIARVKNTKIPWVLVKRQEVYDACGYKVENPLPVLHVKLPIPFAVGAPDPLPALIARFPNNVVPKLSNATWREVWHPMVSHAVSLVDGVVRAARGVMTPRGLSVLYPTEVFCA